MTHRPDPAQVNAAYRQLQRAVAKHYQADAPPPDEPSVPPDWAVPGYRPLEDQSINRATREARHGFLLNLAATHALEAHRTAGAARKLAHQNSITDTTGARP